MVHPSKADPDQSRAGRLVLDARTVVLQGRNERMPRYRRVILCVKISHSPRLRLVGFAFFRPRASNPRYANSTAYARVGPRRRLLWDPSAEGALRLEPRPSSRAGLAFDVLPFRPARHRACLSFFEHLWWTLLLLRESLTSISRPHTVHFRSLSWPITDK
jgi:hypothetical protein